MVKTQIFGVLNLGLILPLIKFEDLRRLTLENKLISYLICLRIVLPLKCLQQWLYPNWIEQWSTNSILNGFWLSGYTCGRLVAYKLRIQPCLFLLVLFQRYGVKCRVCDRCVKKKRKQRKGWFNTKWMIQVDNSQLWNWRLRLYAYAIYILPDCFRQLS